MLSRPVHRRFALLALVATMLLVVMPTLAQLRAPVTSAHPARTHATHGARHADAGYFAPSVAHDLAATGHDGHNDHDSACPYCPLLAGTVQWDAAPSTVPRVGDLRIANALDVHAACTAMRRGTLGSRGPPALRAA